jgi:uncharacterized protein (UPF0261 family)
LKTILCIATLDTKGIEIEYLKRMIEKRGHAVLILDAGSFGEPHFPPDITANEVAKAAGADIKEVRALKLSDAGKIMKAGLIKIVKDLYRLGRFNGVISVGGGSGSALAAAAMRELPVGIPKLMLSSQKIVQAGIRGYVGSSDITVMPSVADIVGLNRLVMQSLNNAAGCITGMVESPKAEVSEKPTACMTMLGSTGRCGLSVRSLLESNGFEVIVFHAIGIGGMTFEDFVKTYPVAGVIELGLNEIGNDLFGGFSSAGPHRLEAAGKKGIPQIITPGNVDFISFLSVETVPDRYRTRNLLSYNPQATPMRLTSDELRLVGETVSRKLNSANGPVKVLIPSLGFSSLDCEGSVFHDLVADRAFIDSLKNSLKETITVKEFNLHIEDERFARIIADEFMDVCKA